MTNYGPDEILNFNTSFARSVSKLSENNKIFDIGSTVLKLWHIWTIRTHSSYRANSNTSPLLQDRSNAQSSCAGLFIGAHLGFDYSGVWIHIDMASPAYTVSLINISISTPLQLCIYM